MALKIVVAILYVYEWQNAIYFQTYISTNDLKDMRFEFMLYCIIISICFCKVDVQMIWFIYGLGQSTETAKRPQIQTETAVIPTKG